MSASRFKYRETMPASFPTHGPAVEITLRDTGDVLGYVRRLLAPVERGSNWMVYGADGSELGVSDLRGTAANWLLTKRGQ